MAGHFPGFSPCIWRCILCLAPCHSRLNTCVIVCRARHWRSWNSAGSASCAPSAWAGTWRIHHTACSAVCVGSAPIPAEKKVFQIQNQVQKNPQQLKFTIVLMWPMQLTGCYKLITPFLKFTKINTHTQHYDTGECGWEGVGVRVTLSL